MEIFNLLRTIINQNTKTDVKQKQEDPTKFDKDETLHVTAKHHNIFTNMTTTVVNLSEIHPSPSRNVVFVDVPQLGKSNIKEFY